MPNEDELMAGLDAGADDLKAAFEKMDLGSKPLKLTAKAEQDVRFSVPTSDPRVRDVLRPSEYLKKNPGATYDNLRADDVVVFVRFARDCFAPKDLYHLTYENDKGEKLANLSRSGYGMAMRRFRADMQSYGLDATQNLEKVRNGERLTESGLPLYKRSGENQVFGTPGGDRIAPYHYVNQTTSGQNSPDLWLFKKDGSEQQVFRYPGDGLEPDANKLRDHFDADKIIAKSTGNFYHSNRYIVMKGWGTINDRLNVHLNEGRENGPLSKVADVSIQIGGRSFYPADMVMRKYPDSEHSNVLRYGPDASDRHFNILVRPWRGQGLQMVELAQRSAHGAFAEMAEKNKIFSGNWYESDSYSKIADGRAGEPYIYVLNEHNWPTPSSHVPERGEAFKDAYPPAKRIVEMEDDQGGRTGYFKSMAGLKLTEISKEAQAELAQLLALRSHVKNEPAIEVKHTVGPGAEAPKVAGVKRPASDYDNRERDSRGVV